MLLYSFAVINIEEIAKIIIGLVKEGNLFQDFLKWKYCDSLFQSLSSYICFYFSIIGFLPLLEYNPEYTKDDFENYLIDVYESNE